MNKKQKQINEIKKLSIVNGTKKLPNGFFVDLLYCPSCKKHVESLIFHIQEVHMDDKGVKA